MGHCYFPFLLRFPYLHMVERMYPIITEISKCKKFLSAVMSLVRMWTWPSLISWAGKVWKGAHIWGVVEVAEAQVLDWLLLGLCSLQRWVYLNFYVRVQILCLLVLILGNQHQARHCFPGSFSIFIKRLTWYWGAVLHPLNFNITSAKLTHYTINQLRLSSYLRVAAFFKQQAHSFGRMVVLTHAIPADKRQWHFSRYATACLLNL